MNTCVLSCDLKSENESMFLSSVDKIELQRWGAERLNALCPMVVTRPEGTGRCMEEEDGEGVGTWTWSDRYGERGCGSP